MKTMKIITAALVIILSSSILSAQDQKPANLDAAPPYIAFLTHQGVIPGKAADREKLEIEISRACDRLEIPRFWIDLEPLTGQSVALVFSPFDSYEQLGQSDTDWTQFLATHPDLGHEREQIEGLISGQSKIVAVRRDDLGYLAESIDLSEARFVNVLEVHVFPGREDDFADAFKKVDAILTPTSPTAAFKLGEKVEDPLSMYLADIFTVTADLAGIPGISVPCGDTPENLPIGLQILGRHFDEATILRVAHAYELEHRKN